MIDDDTALTTALVRRARSLSFGPALDEATLVAKTCILDWLGCALAGSDEPLVRVLLGDALAEGGSNRATVIGHELRTSTQSAAAMNAAASHALDYDDTLFVFPELPIHPTTPVLSAVLALAEAHGASGAELLRAFIAGVEMECRLGRAMGVDHYATGWHATATLGVFGATAACCHLLALPEATWCHALGIAGTKAAGLKSVFGSMAKALQVGSAAANGLMAASYAARGVTSHPAIIEAHQGFAATHHATSVRPEALDEVEKRFLITDTVFKYHASCYLTHSAIEGVRQLVDHHKIVPATVGKVDVYVPAQHLDVCNIGEPRSGLEGKFSLRATVAMALLGDDTADPAAFTDQRMGTPERVKMRKKVVVRASADMSGAETRVNVHLEDGTTCSATIDVGKPASDLERQWTSITEKFERLAVPVIGDQTAQTVAHLVHELDRVDDVGDLLAQCRTSAARSGTPNHR